MNPMLFTDFYKQSHYQQYPKNTEMIYSTWTPRMSRIHGIDKVVAFGFQYFIKEFLIDAFNENFFKRPKSEVINEHRRVLKNSLGIENPDVSHIEALHDLAYLPIRIKAVKEGSRIPIRVPILTIENTKPEFFWLTNYLETFMSCILWQPTTSATIAYEYRKMLNHYAQLTGGSMDFVPFQGHDFSFRGMSSIESAMTSGAGHALSFVGSDTIPAITFLEKYYNANIEKELVLTSIPACYDEETEILTDKGWKFFKDLDKSEKVAQYHENGAIDFVLPTEYYDMPYNGDMIHFSKTGHRYIDLLVTPNHKMVRKNIKDNSIELVEANTKKYHIHNIYSNQYRIITSGVIGGNTNLSPLDKLKIAFQADGSYVSHKEDYTGERSNCIPIRFSLKKDRKKDRLVSILKELHYEYTLEKYSDGYYSFWIKIPMGIEFKKDFSWVILSDVSSEWCREFIDELQYWDGNKSSKNTISYSSKIKINNDIVQAIGVLCGCKIHQSIYIDKRTDYDRVPIYTSIITIGKNMVSGAHIVRETVPYNGRVYCVSVPTKMLVVRRKDAAVICGNTEHSVMCAYGRDELESYRHLIKDVYPEGFISIVSDTWDLWSVLNDAIRPLKDEIMSRNGRIVIRPDSGSPVKIICGDPDSEDVNEKKGVIQILWEIFGGKTNDMGFKELDPHIGCIYGDAITLDMCDKICSQLMDKGFASTNMVYGIGSFTYQYNTRDTFGFALKSTYGIFGGIETKLYKDPVTDKAKFKKSQTGLCIVVEDEDGIKVVDSLCIAGRTRLAPSDLLEDVFIDGVLVRDQSLSEIRKILSES